MMSGVEWVGWTVVELVRSDGWLGEDEYNPNIT